MLQLLQQQQQAAIHATNTPAGYEPCCDTCCLNHNPASNPTAVALRVADRLGSMSAVATKAQCKQLLHCLLEVAVTGNDIAAAAAALAVSAIRFQQYPDHQDAASFHVALVQPNAQMLLLQALGSSTRIVSTAAADVLADLWYDIRAGEAALAAVPGYAATMQQAAAEVLSGSGLAAPAAELCWFASKRWSGSSDLLVVHATALLGAAADVPFEFEGDQPQQQQQQQQQQQHVRSQIFSLAALCKLSNGQGLQDALAGLIAEQQLSPLLQLFLNRFLSDEAYAAAANAAMPQLVNLLQRLLHALRCSGEGSDHFEERLAVAACEVLSCIDGELLQYVMYMLARQLEQLEQQQQQQHSSSSSNQQQQQQPSATSRASLQPGHMLLAELLLACAPGPNVWLQHLDEASKPACAIDSFLGHDVREGLYWNNLVAAAPTQTREVIIMKLLLQATSEAAAAAADASTSNSSSRVGGAKASSSSATRNLLKHVDQLRCKVTSSMCSVPAGVGAAMQMQPSTCTAARRPAQQEQASVLRHKQQSCCRALHCSVTRRCSCPCTS
jgi:hypothetical protein